MNTQLTIKEFLEIHSIVNTLAKQLSEDLKKNLIKRFCFLFREITNDERKLIIVLSKKMINISLSNYYFYLCDIVKKIAITKLKTAKKIYIIPIHPSNKDNKIKSGDAVAYFIPQILDIIYGHEIGLKCNILNDIDKLEMKKNRNNSLIILCDNFIGSGKQAKTCIHRYQQYKKDDDNIIFITLAIMNKTYIEMNNDYEIYYQLRLNSGISDNKYLNKTNALNIMQRIESRMKIPAEFRLGRYNTEALVAFDFKAPNNTFPIFWYKKNKNKKRNTIFIG